MNMIFDTSVLVKWYHQEGEAEVDQAQWHLEAHRAGLVTVHLLDFGIYELGNVALSLFKSSKDKTFATIQLAIALCGEPLVLNVHEFGLAAQIACDDRLSFYDASFAAAAKSRDMMLVSADKKLLQSGHAISLTESMQRIGASG